MKAITKQFLSASLALCLMTGSAPIASAEVLFQEGDKGTKVLEIKNIMLELGYYNAKASHNQFNATMTERVKQLQQVNGLPETGVIDDELYARLLSGNLLCKNGLPLGALVKGDKSKSVQTLRARLHALNYYEKKAAGNVVLDDDMLEHVQLLQQINGMEPTPYVSPALYDFIMSDDCLPFTGRHDSYYSAEEARQYALSDEKLLSLSASGNVVIFLIDQFASNYAVHLVREFPHAFDAFKDFTHYTNCDPRYIGAYPAITHMLTGAEYDPSLKVGAWFQQAWSSEKARQLYESIHTLGYEFRYYDSDILAAGMKEEALGLVNNLMDLRAHAGMTTPAYSDSQFLKQLQTNGLTVDPTDQKYIQLIRLNGSAAPNLSREEKLLGCLETVQIYLDEMRAKGLYDDASILITSSHGDYNANMQVVYLLKEAGQTQPEMTQNAAPISHDDFPATLLALIGGDASALGSSIFDWTESDQRQRTCSMPALDARLYPLSDSYAKDAKAAYNVWKTYTYTGDNDDLIEMYRRNRYDHTQIKQSFE